MKITLKQLSRYEEPCAAGVEWLKLQKDYGLSALVKMVIKNRPFQHKDKTCYPLDFALWALPQLMTKRQAVQFAVYAAREVLDIFEAKYPNDDRPRLAVEAAEEWLENPCLATAEAAKAAAWAAGAAEAAGAAWVAWAAGTGAAWVAWAAGAVAEAAAKAAAGAEAGAAWAAWAEAGAAEAAEAARAAAGAAAWAAGAAKYNMAVKIVRYGVKILGEKN